MKPIVDIFAINDKSGKVIWSIRGRNELKHVKQQFHSREEAFAYVEGLRQGYELGIKR